MSNDNSWESGFFIEYALANPKVGWLDAILPGTTVGVPSIGDDHDRSRSWSFFVVRVASLG